MGVGHALDGRDVDGSIVHAEVIAVDQYGEGCDGAQAGERRFVERYGDRLKRRFKR